MDKKLEPLPKALTLFPKRLLASIPTHQTPSEFTNPLHPSTTPTHPFRGGHSGQSHLPAPPSSMLMKVTGCRSRPIALNIEEGVGEGRGKRGSMGGYGREACWRLTLGAQGGTKQKKCMDLAAACSEKLPPVPGAAIGTATASGKGSVWKHGDIPTPIAGKTKLPNAIVSFA